MDSTDRTKVGLSASLVASNGWPLMMYFIGWWLSQFQATVNSEPDLIGFNEFNMNLCLSPTLRTMSSQFG
ncbi:hypothetical protein WICPIJ_007880 [Wickerhamomyces pijperi]|uniref:Uncharacterized protein n=1 Tax=Wickerhamomyces pijperi TaxID=599730 RepID=A0A9P8TJQ9_WICPI|nr:hypothetical protein WICPIJ_007880 [Wickerhamomyces pijperi]